MHRFKAVGSILGGVSVVALGATAVFAAPAPAPTDLKADVTQGQADQANDQVGKAEAGQVAEAEHDSATEADNNGPNDQVGDQAEAGDKANAQSTEDTGNTGAADPAEKAGATGEQAGSDGNHEDPPAPAGAAPKK